MKTIRIFISSPGDVKEERDKAKQVIADLQRRYDGQATLLPVLWEDLAIPATASFQEGIDYVLAERHRIDIAVFILWSRLGSPLSDSITKPDGSQYLSGTEREFDLMLAAFEKSGGKVPIILAYTRRDEEGFNNRLDATAQGDDALEELIKQRKLVKRFIRENFQDKEGHNLRAYHSYPEPVAFAQRLHVHLRGSIDDLLELDASAVTWTEAPYRSLEVFDIKHAPIFCGRDEETCDLLQRLRDQQRTGCAFVCIVGASGSGKSSLARAGIAATLMQRSFEDGVKEWRTAVLLPSLAQGYLYRALARTLAEALPELRTGVGGLDEFTSCLREQNFKAAAILLTTAFNGKRVLIILDQMEELWTDRTITPEQREQFLQIIEALSRTGSITVLATLRSDFYPQAQLSETFLRMKGERGHFDLIPPGPAALQQLIVQPAHRAGLRFERDERTNRTLDQRILEDAARDPSALPLLQYALAELYERRDEQKHLLTFAAYEAMGGVEGALGKRATQTFEKLPTEAQAALDELLPLLVSVDIAGEQNAVRRRAALADLTNTQGRRNLAEALIVARFLTTDEDKQIGVAVATLAHEALLHRWERITHWIDSNRELLRMRARVEQYQAMWEESDNDASRLLPAGLPLEEGRELLEARTQILAESAQSFIINSATHHQAQERHATQRRRMVIAVLSGITVLALTATFIALQKFVEAAEARMRISLDSDKQRALLGEAARSDRLKAEEKLNEGDGAAALTYLARALTYEPTSTLAAEKAVIALNTWHHAPPEEIFSEKEHPQLSADGLHVFTGFGSNSVNVKNARNGKVIAALVGHTGKILSAVLSHDSRMVATTSDDGTARVWDLQQGTMQTSLRGHTSAVTGAVFSPDDRRVLTTSKDKTARLWELPSGRLLFTLVRHKKPGVSAWFSPDGERIVTENKYEEASAYLWDSKSGSLLAELGDEDNLVADPLFSPDSRRITVTLPNRNRVRITDAKTGKLLNTLEPGGVNPHVEFSPNGELFVTSDTGNCATIWDAETGSKVAMLNDGTFPAGGGAQFSPDGKLVATISSDNCARIWNTISGTLVHKLAGHGSYLTSVRFNQSGGLLLTASDDRTARLWSVRTGESLIECKGHEARLRSARFSKDGRFFITNSEDGTSRLWNARTANLVEILPVLEGEVEPQFSANGQYVAAQSGDGTVRVWATEPTSLAARFAVPQEYRVDTSRLTYPEEMGGAIFTRKGDRIAASLGASGSFVWNASDGQMLSKLEAEEDFRLEHIAFSPDGESILGTGWAYAAHVWNAETGKLTLKLGAGDKLLRWARYSPDGRWIVTCPEEGATKLWDAATGQEKLTLSHTSKAEFSPDSTLLVASIADGVQILNVNDGAVRLTFNLPKDNGTLESVKFSPEPGNRRILTTSSKSDDTFPAIELKSLRLWDSQSGQLVAALPHFGEVNGASFSPDGKRLAVAVWHDTCIFETGTGKKVTALTGYDGRVFDVGFSTDNLRVMTRTQGDFARLWDASNGKLVAVIRMGPTPRQTDGYQVAYDPAGGRIAVPSKDDLLLWHILPASAGNPPPWFSEFLQYMSQKRVNGDGEIENIPAKEWLEIRERLRVVAADVAGIENKHYLHSLRQLIRR